jgi:hypothetical protein
MTSITLDQIVEALNTNPTLRADLSRYISPRNSTRDEDIARRVWAGETHGAVAAAFGLSVNRIAQIMSTRPNPNPSKRSKNEERDRLILDAVDRKVSRAEIAQTHGLSLVRVNQIVATRPKKKKRTFEVRFAEALVKYKAFDDLTFAEECTLFIGLHEQIARQVVRDMDNGMEQAEIEAKYPPDCTGQDLPLTYDHYNVAYRYFIDPATGAWKR